MKSLIVLLLSVALFCQSLFAFDQIVSPDSINYLEHTFQRVRLNRSYAKRFLPLSLEGSAAHQTTNILGFNGNAQANRSPLFPYTPRQKKAMALGTGAGVAFGAFTGFAASARPIIAEAGFVESLRAANWSPLGYIGRGMAVTSAVMLPSAIIASDIAAHNPEQKGKAIILGGAASMATALLVAPLMYRRMGLSFRMSLGPVVVFTGLGFLASFLAAETAAVVSR